MFIATAAIGGSAPATIQYTYGAQDPAGPVATYTFSGVPIGSAGATRRLLLWCTSGVITSVTVDGNGASFIGGTLGGYIISYPSGTTATIAITNSSTQTHCTLIVFALYNVKSATPVGAVLVGASTTNPKSSTIAVTRGGVVSAFSIGGGLGASMTYAFGGNLTTDLSNSQSENTCMGAGHGSAAVTDAAWAINVTRSGTNNNFSFQALSFR